MHVDQDLADVLTEQFNSYASMMEGIDMLPLEWVLNQLQTGFDPEDLKFLIEDDFGRGIIMGQLHIIYSFTNATEPDDGESI